jgi:outer membrane protein assembly factor BamB
VFIGSDEGAGLSETGAVYAFDAATGDNVFTAPIGAGRGLSCPTIIPNAGGDSNCPPLPDPCQPTRSLPLGAPSRSSPAVAAGWIYVGTDDGRLHAFHT